ncbi:MAG: MFS transporter [Candidatus Dormibacteria bacterium]
MSLEPLRRNRNFQLLWVGQGLSALGSNASDIAYPLLVLALTRSPLKAGLVGTFYLIAQMAFRLPAGAIADRVNRRALMLASDLVRLLALGGLGAAVLLGLASWQLVLVVAFVQGAASTFFGPAQRGLVRTVVPTEQLAAASARNEAGTYGATVAGPPLGGALFALARSAPFLADAVSYAISLLTLLGLRGHFSPDPAKVERQGLHRDVAAGIRFVWDTPFLRALVIQLPLMNFATNGAMFAMVVILRVHGVYPAVIGVAESLIAVGGLLGAVCAPWMQRRLSLSALILLQCWGGTALLAVGAWQAGAVVMALPIGLAIFLAPAANASMFAREALITPNELQGRVDSVLMFASMGLAVVAPAAAGFFIAEISGGVALLIFALALGVAAVIATASPAIRRTESASLGQDA